LRRPGSGRFPVYLVAGAVSAALIWIVRYAPEDLMRWLVAGVGAVGAIMLSMTGWRTGSRRFTLMAALLVGAGIAISAAGVEFSRGMALFWAIAAVCFLVSGAMTLYGFLHATPAAEE
jgi:hypothetical protein